MDKLLNVILLRVVSNGPTPEKEKRRDKVVTPMVILYPFTTTFIICSTELGTRIEGISMFSAFYTAWSIAEDKVW